MEKHGTKKNLKIFKTNRIIISVVIGAIVLVLLLLNTEDFNFTDIFTQIQKGHIGWILLALFTLMCRDMGYIYRIRYLTEKELSWTSSVYVIFLWEFASSITPSVVGGSAVAIFILNKEKISFGKSITYVSISAILDNIFFMVGSLVAIVFISYDTLIPDISTKILFFDENYSLKYIFYISIFIIFMYTLFMLMSILFKPQWIKNMLLFFTKNRFLRRFRAAAEKNGNDIITVAEVLKHKKMDYWLQAILSTIFIWTARYFLLNCIIVAFSPDDIGVAEHFIIFGRQIVMWIIMLISPTPGSSGTAEFFFNQFFNQFFIISGLSIFISFIWRIITYYTYIAIGLFLLPRWIKKIEKK